MAELYRVALKLSNSTGLGPEWLPAAVRTSLPGSELVDVESYDGSQAVVRMRGVAPAYGAHIAATPEGLQLPLPGAPTADVMAVETSGSEPEPVASSGTAPAVQILGALGLIALVWYLIHRIPHV